MADWDKETQGSGINDLKEPQNARERTISLAFCNMFDVHRHILRFWKKIAPGFGLWPRGFGDNIAETETGCYNGKKEAAMYYLNTNTPVTLFEEIRNSEIYVDKSPLIRMISKKIKTTDKYVCITRPRRFGKTINANMLGAYYTKGYDSTELFQDLAIAKTGDHKTHMNRHNVIYMDLSKAPDFCADYKTYMLGIVKKMRSDLNEAYPCLEGREYDSLSEMLHDTKNSFFFIIDEWDSVFHEDFIKEQDKVNYLKFLKGLLKDQPYVEMVYMTGVLPIAKYSSGSELNMFDEYSFMNDSEYDHYFGFSEDEVRMLCEQYGSISFEEMKKWYDGYYRSDGSSLFNPRSVSKALMRGVCLNYWTETGPMNEIAECIENNVGAVREDIVKMVAGIPVSVKLNGYSAAELQLNTRDEILSAMVVYGFLSYHDRLIKIPNHELMEKYQAVLERKSMGEVKEIVDRSREMLKATLAGDEAGVAAILEEVHDREIPFLQYNDENALSCVITLCYLAARDDYQMLREEKSGKGYCDYLFSPKNNRDPAIILELKVDESGERAIEQIKHKKYIQRVEHYPEILLVGINYDRKNKKHECRIERIQGMAKRRPPCTMGDGQK